MRPGELLGDVVHRTGGAWVTDVRDLTERQKQQLEKMFWLPRGSMRKMAVAPPYPIKPHMQTAACMVCWKETASVGGEPFFTRVAASSLSTICPEHRFPYIDVPRDMPMEERLEVANAFIQETSEEESSAWMRILQLSVFEARLLSLTSADACYEREIIKFYIDDLRETFRDTWNDLEQEFREAINGEGWSLMFNERHQHWKHDLDCVPGGFRRQLQDIRSVKLRRYLLFKAAWLLWKRRWCPWMFKCTEEMKQADNCLKRGKPCPALGLIKFIEEKMALPVG